MADSKVLKYDAQVEILSKLLNRVEVEYSIRDMENTIHIDIDIDSMMKQIESVLGLYSKEYKEESGSTLLQSSSIANAVNSSQIRIHLADKHIDICREYETYTVNKLSGYKIKG